MARYPTLCSIICVDVLTHRSCKQPSTPQTYAYTHLPTALNVLPHMPAHLLCSSPHLLLVLAFSCILVIRSAPSLNLYLQPLFYSHPFQSLTSLLSFLHEFDIASISLYLSPMPRELTHPSLPHSTLIHLPLFQPLFVITAGD